MKNNLLKAGMIDSLVMAMAAPAILPNVVFAQSDIRQEDRQADRREDRQLDRRGDRQVDQLGDHGGHGRRANGSKKCDEALATTVMSASLLPHCRFSNHRCRLPRRSCFSRTIWREARSCAAPILARSFVVMTPSDLALPSILLTCSC